jgi:hypothetical protein
VLDHINVKPSEPKRKKPQKCEWKLNKVYQGRIVLQGFIGLSLFVEKGGKIYMVRCKVIIKSKEGQNVVANFWFLDQTFKDDKMHHCKTWSCCKGTFLMSY